MYIYKITNKVNKRVYVGKTINYEKRKKSHIKTHKNKNNPRYYNPLYQDMRKYGVDNFEFSILEEVTSEDVADKREIYWIKKLSSLIDFGGYNLEKGGSHGKRSEYTKRKFSEINTGERNPCWGIRGAESWHAKKVINLTDNIIYGSMIDCAIAEYGDKNKLKIISSVCNPNSNKFTYKGKEYRAIDEQGNIIEKNTTKLKNIRCIKIIDNISGKIYNSISDCAKDLNISHSMVRDRIYNRIKNDKFKDLFSLEIYANDEA